MSNILAPSVAIDVLKVIYERRAVRRYKDKPVDRALIEQVLDAGRMAPSALNNQPWHFYILTDRQMIDRFSKEITRTALKGVMKSGVLKLTKAAAGLLHFITHPDWEKLKDPVFHGAPAVIFLTAPVNYEWAALDIGMCAQNIMLAAKALGLDTCPVGFGKFVAQTKDYPLLHIPAEEEVLLSIIIGYGNETPEVHEHKTGNMFFVQ
ncbi:hypothetical protein A4D02_23555 [Niastella koreensis]|uniref:Nitroreductase n=2 Tax=Niastella koreensis TaxID=354356 RepID=G8TAW5_NIAKG|nr:nitroreductase [Niastella koreensis]AEW00308.1 nitroreductase [Niastella koreensis GR20-10]OQP52176.1 hypothetical protein A4D02_23555 [Niastella koreensis]